MTPREEPQSIGDPDCSYLMTAGGVCNKCGRIHRGAPAQGRATAWVAKGPRGGVYHFSEKDGWTVDAVVFEPAAAQAGTDYEAFERSPLELNVTGRGTATLKSALEVEADRLRGLLRAAHDTAAEHARARTCEHCKRIVATLKEFHGH